MQSEREREREREGEIRRECVRECERERARARERESLGVAGNEATLSTISGWSNDHSTHQMPSVGGGRLGPTGAFWEQRLFIPECSCHVQSPHWLRGS